MLTLAWRNLGRKRGRSLMTVGAVGLVVVLTLVYFGLGSAIQNGMHEGLTSNTGHFQVHVADYRELRDFGDLLIRDADTVVERLEAAAPAGAEVVAALSVPGLLEGNGRSRGVVVEGVSRPGALQARYADEYLAEGQLPADEADPEGDEGVALSLSLARALGVGMGDTVYMYAPGTEGYGAAAYTVVGLLDLPGTQAAQVSLPAAQDLAAPDAVSRLELHLPDFRLSDDATLPTLQADLGVALGEGLSVESWREVNPGIAAYVNLIPIMMAVVTGIFFVLAGLLVTNTVYLSVIERVREFGVIQALGARRRKVMGMVLGESLLLCGVGALIGAALGTGIVAVMAQGFSFPEAYNELLAGSGFPAVLYASLAPGQLVVASLFTIATGVLAALLPALTAVKLEPIEAIRFTA